MNDETSESLLEYLKKYHNGEQQAASSKKLEVAFSLSNRQVRHMVSGLRHDNHPICSSDKGYFYSDNQQELQRCIRNLENRGRHIFKARRGLKEALKKLEMEEDYHGISLFTE